MASSRQADGGGLGEDLDAVVRRVDLDRWLASRFISDPAARAEVIAIYALDHELGRALSVASQPMMADVRLTWWVEALDEIYEGRPARRHPVVLALAAAIEGRDLPRDLFTRLLDAYFAEPLDRRAAAEAVMRLAATVLGAPAIDASAAAAAWADRDPGRLKAANEQLHGLPAIAFPTVAYATLVRGKGGDIGRRLRLMWSIVRGRL